ncbi:MAG: hypothetical protein DCE90_01175 [Pseudanabaena sp.]|nr:MAG: hypothetical protein DCE90_01175 [Pseudanabaena sp.]
MKIKSVLAAIALLGALLLVLSMTTVSKILGAVPTEVLAGSQSQPQIAAILPKRSLFFLSILAKPEQLGLFAKLAAKPRDRTEVSHELHKLKQQLSQNWLLDYERDVQPWLDREVALAMTSIDLDDKPSNGLQTGYLLAFAIQDAELAKNKINRFWQRLAVNGTDIRFEQYRGFSILSVEIEKGKPTIAQTITDKFVLFANDRQVLHQVIDTIDSPQSAIANLDSYQNSLPKFGDKPDGRFGFAYANLTDFGEGDFLENVLVSLNLDKSGIKLKTTSAALSQSSLSPSRDIVNKVPVGSSIVFGRNLNQTLQNSEKILPTILRKYLTKTLSPIPLDSRVWSWVQGDYAIASIPNATNTLDWLLVSKVENAIGTQTAVAELDNLFRSKFTIGEITLGQQPVTIWTNLSAIADDRLVSGNIALAHAQTSEYIYFSNSLPVLQSTLSLKSKQAIASSREFKRAISHLSAGQSTYAYLNKEIWQQWQEIPLGQTLSQMIENSPLPVIAKHLDLIGSASDNSSFHSLNGEIFLQLK